MKQDPYRWIAGWYDRAMDPLNRGLRAAGLKLHPPGKGARVLDVGCGTGMLLDLYEKAGCRICGIDPSPSMLGEAKARLGDRADLRLGDASRMPFEEGAFDLVTAMFVLHEMEAATRDAVLREMKRVVGEKGNILLIDFHPGPTQFPRGWQARGVIWLAEAAAGYRHFRSFRRFMALEGLPALMEEHGLTVVKERIVGGGALALYLTRL